MNPIHRYLVIDYQTYKPHTKVPSQKYISKLDINSFIHQICIEHIIMFRHCSMCWEHSSE